MTGRCATPARALFIVFSIVFWLFGGFYCFLGRMGKMIRRVTPFFNLALLPLPFPISSCSSQLADSIMYVHNTRFYSRTFSIIFPVNSLAATITLLHVFAEGGRLHLRSLCLCSHSISKTPDRCDKLHPFTSVCTCKILRCGHTCSSITAVDTFLRKKDAVTGQTGAPVPLFPLKTNESC